MAWPVPQDYNEAVQDPVTSFADPDLRAGTAAADALGIPRPRSGNFADVYEFTCPSGKWAVKCFTREVRGLHERYAAVSAHLQQVKLPFTVNFQYLDQGVRIRGRWYPVVKMRWVEGLTLNEFVRANLDKPALLEALCQIWARMARRLREARIAHGDLQHGNVLLVPASSAAALAVKLIDYDGMWVPALADCPSAEVGHPNYQHPQRMRDGLYSPEADRFAVLVVAAALYCLRTGGKDLWERYDNGDNLLFKEADFVAPHESPLFAELLKLNDRVGRQLAACTMAAAQLPLEKAVLLEDVLPEKSPAAPSPRSVPATPAPASLPPPAPDPFRFAPTPGRKRAAARKRSAVPLVLGVLLVLAAAAGGVVLWGRYASSDTQPQNQDDGLVAWRGEKKEPPASTPASAPVKDKVPEKTSNQQPDDPARLPKRDRKDPPKSDPKPDPVSKQPLIKPREPPPKEGPQPPREVFHLAAGPPGEVRKLNLAAAGVRRLALSPDGRRVLAACYDGALRLWDLGTGRRLLELTGHTAPHINAVVFCSDARALSAGADRVLRLWDLGTGKQISQWAGHDSDVFHLASSPDGKYALSCAMAGPALLWELSTGRLVHRLPTGDKGAPYAAFAADSRLVAVACNDGFIRIWEIATGREVQKLAKDPRGEGVAFSRDGRHLLVTENQVLRLWDWKTGKELQRFEGHTAGIFAVAFTPDGRRAASCGGDNTVRLWDLQSGREVVRFVGHTDWVFDVVGLPGGRHILSASRDGTARLWCLPAADPVAIRPAAEVGEVRKFEGHAEGIRRIALSSDGRRALSAAYDETVRLWDIASGHELRRFKGHTQPHIQTVAFWHDGRHALSGGDDRVLRLWDLEDGQETRHFLEQASEIRHLAISPDGRFLLSCSKDSDVLLWDARAETILHRLGGHEGGASSLAFSPDSRQALTGSSRGGVIRLWDTAIGQEVRRLTGHNPQTDIICLAFFPEGRYAISGGEDASIRLWDLTTGRELRQLAGHTSGVFGVAVSPDGRRVLSCGWDKTVRLWDVSSAKEVKRLTGHGEPVWDVTFTPEGGYALSGSADKTLRLWRLPQVPLIFGTPLTIEPAAVPVVTPQKAPDRDPEPDAGALIEARDRVRNSLAVEYTKRRPDQRRALALHLLEKGKRPAETPAIRCVYFLEARDLAAGLPDPALALRAVDELARVFAIDSVARKAEALAEAVKATRASVKFQTIAAAALAVTDEAIKADDFPGAQRLVRIAADCAGNAGNAELSNAVRLRKDRLATLEKEYAKVKDAASKLEQQPGDPSANLLVGRYRVLEIEDWDRGLRNLAQGSDEVLAEPARKEQAGIQTIAAKMEAADGWWAAAQRETGHAKTVLQRRAQDLYRHALPDLKDPERTRAADRLKVILGRLQLRPGLVTELFGDEDFSRRVKTRIDYRVNYNWGDDAPDKDLPADHFALRWQGYLLAPRPGLYTLVVNADDGARLWLDGESVLDSWKEGGRKTATVALGNKPHLLVLEYHEGIGQAMMYFGWQQDNGFAEQPVPLEALYHDADQAKVLGK
jgi:WD40 repeat protein